MKQKENGNLSSSISFGLGIIGFMLLVVFIAFVVSSTFWAFETRHITIDSEIASVEPITKDGEIECLLVTFENGEQYKVGSGETEVDLTVNSKLIIELQNMYHRNFWWEEFEPYDDVWYINQIIKVPDTKNVSGIIEVVTDS